MAKCDLRIELDDIDPQQHVFTGDETVRGRVWVQTSAPVQCRGLKVATRYRTHGRGNVQTGDADSKIVFSGQWDEGQTLSYPFELTVGRWPPTYHGHYLNVDHFVEADADIPWAFDPKASCQIFLRPVTSSSSKPPAPKKQASSKGMIAVIGSFLIVALTVVLIVGALIPILILSVVVGLPVGLFALFLKTAPKRVLGETTLVWDADRKSPGDTIDGTIKVTPRKPAKILGVSLQLKGTEKVISGSGSNRTTHRHDFFDQTIPLAPESTLAAGQTHRFPISFALPDDLPYSITLKDNELLYTLEARIGIARWPDWKQKAMPEILPLPSQDEGQSRRSDQTVPAVRDRDYVVSNASSVTAAADQSFAETPIEDSSNASVSFAEVMRLVQLAGNDVDQIDTILAALAEITLPATFDADRRLLYAGDEAQFLRGDEHAWWGLSRHTNPPVRLTIYVDGATSHSWTTDQRENVSGDVVFVGYDSKDDRVRLRWLSGRSTGH
ncbi:MAG: sporulation protein [Planctomycetota bacterium]